MKLISPITASVAFVLSASVTHAAFVSYEAAGATAASITTARNDFRLAVGGGTAPGANGDFGGVRREINWDGVPASFSDPNALPANFFNVNSPRGVVFSTPGSGFLVSANSGGLVPPLFGFPNDFQAFSQQKLFTALDSNITDVHFFVPGTTIPATTGAFGLIFTDVEALGSTKLEFFDLNNALIYSQNAMASGNLGLSFLGAIGDSGERIGRVRITSGLNKIVSNGALSNFADDVVAMDDFLYATPIAASSAVPEPGTAIFGLALAGIAATRRRLRGSGKQPAQW